jgi:hypothetical protein
MGTFAFLEFGSSRVSTISRTREIYQLTRQDADDAVRDFAGRSFKGEE